MNFEDMLAFTKMENDPKKPDMFKCFISGQLTEFAKDIREFLDSDEVKLIISDGFDDDTTNKPYAHAIYDAFVTANLVKFRSLSKYKEGIPEEKAILINPTSPLKFQNEVMDEIMNDIENESKENTIYKCFLRRMMKRHKICVQFEIRKVKLDMND